MSGADGSKNLIRYIDNRLRLDGDKDKDGNFTDLEKKQFAYQIWREDFEKKQKLTDRKESEVKDTWTEIYQLIGFDNVFQGVWFQGVTQLAALRGCRFSAIPIILSVFVSLVTIVAVFLKISKVRHIEESLHKDQFQSWVLQSFISACERKGVDFDFDTIEDDDYWMRIYFEKKSVVSRIKWTILLVSLTIASILFAWLLHLIMCGKYD